MVSLKQYISDLGSIVWHKKLDGSDPLTIDNSIDRFFRDSVILFSPQDGVTGQRTRPMATVDNPKEAISKP